ncbi:MAG: septum formation inhibitor Maf [Bacilli bacterium]|nr:septum formation inhibitor Maf [Bacilli bacterium]
MKIILASNSPRRKELFKYIVDDFTVHVSEIIEDYDPTFKPEEIVTYLSKQKALAVSKTFPTDVIVGSDTIVYIDGEVLGKPHSKEEAYKMLRKLAGRTHKVYTGVTIIYHNQIESFYSETSVTFYEMSDAEIYQYIETNEPMDKAGAYGIQGYGAKFIKSIEGDYFTVVGLPVALLYQHLKKYL